jgi:uncharacterized membrane protein
MLPRYFVYHQERARIAENALWIDRERKLLKIILALPRWIVVWVLGLALAWTDRRLSQGWFHAKLLLVLPCRAITAGWRAMPRSWRGASAGFRASSCACSTRCRGSPRR